MELTETIPKGLCQCGVAANALRSPWRFMAALFFRPFRRRTLAK